MPLRKVSEYEQHAKECRTMAAAMRKPEHKQALEEMAKAWETLARERRAQLNKQQSTVSQKHEVS